MTQPSRTINTITPRQCRAARAWLGWSQEDLALNSGVSKRCIADFEIELRKPLPVSMSAIKMALSGWGVEFMDDGGIMLSDMTIEERNRLKKKRLDKQWMDLLMGAAEI